MKKRIWLFAIIAVLLITTATFIYKSRIFSNPILNPNYQHEPLNQATSLIVDNYSKVSIKNENIIKVPVNSGQYNLTGTRLICSENEILHSDNLNQISVYDINTKSKKILTHIENDRYQADEPQISREWAVWVEWDRAQPGHYSIYKYNLKSNEKNIVKKSDLQPQSLGLVRLALDGDKLVATENTANTELANINIYNLTDNTCKIIGTALISQLPEINGNMVAWKGLDDQYKKPILYIYDLMHETTRTLKDIPPDVIWIQLDKEYLAIQTTSRVNIYNLKDLGLLKTIEAKSGFFNVDMEDGLICWSSVQFNREIYVHSLNDSHTYLIENRRGYLPKLVDGALMFAYNNYLDDKSKEYSEVYIINDIKKLLL